MYLRVQRTPPSSVPGSPVYSSPENNLYGVFYFWINFREEVPWTPRYRFCPSQTQYPGLKACFGKVGGKIIPGLYLGVQYTPPLKIMQCVPRNQERLSTMWVQEWSLVDSSAIHWKITPLNIKCPYSDFFFNWCRPSKHAVNSKMEEETENITPRAAISRFLNSSLPESTGLRPSHKARRSQTSSEPRSTRRSTRKRNDEPGETDSSSVVENNDPLSESHRRKRRASTSPEDSRKSPRFVLVSTDLCPCRVKFVLLNYYPTSWLL